MSRPALKRIRPSDKMKREDMRYGVCPDCGRRGLLGAAGVCAAPRDVKCIERKMKRALRSAPRLD